MGRFIFTMQVEADRANAQPPTPFRNIFAAPSATELEGRVLAIVREFDSKVHRPFQRRLESVAVKARRQFFLSDEDREFLVDIFRRNQRFMTNIETILEDAVRDQQSMDRSVVQRCHESWDLANATCLLVEDVLQAHDSRRTSTSRYERKRQTIPQAPNLGNITLSSRVEACGTSSQLADVPTEIAQLELKSTLSLDDVRQAQSVFQQTHGNRIGKAKFLQWLARQPTATLRTLQDQLHFD